MRISDWSSDVCSSDLAVLCDRLRVPVQLRHLAGGPEPVLGEAQLDRLHHRAGDAQMGIAPGAHRGAAAEVFIAEVQAADEDRKSVVEGKSVSVRVDRGCRRTIKKTKHTKHNDT